MIKEIKTEKFEGLAVLVPTDIESFHIQYFSMAGTWLTESNSKNLNAWKVSLPFRNKQGKIKYEIVGKATELTEDQYTGIVDSKINYTVKFYKSYVQAQKGISVYECTNSKESFKSLLQSLGCDSNLTWLILKKLIN